MTPIRIATIGDKVVRFYPSPHDGPDLPWVAFPDALALALLPDSYAEDAQEQWGRAWPGLARHLPDGTMIVPDTCARGLFQWCGMHDWKPAAAAGQGYEQAAAEVFANLHSGLDAADYTALLQRAVLQNTPFIRGVHHAH